MIMHPGDGPSFWPIMAISVFIKDFLNAGKVKRIAGIRFLHLSEITNHRPLSLVAKKDHRYIHNTWKIFSVVIRDAVDVTDM